MATLDRVLEMQQKGVSEVDISQQLQNEGVSTKEITDSLAQAKVKAAVSPPEQLPGQVPGQMPPPAQGMPQEAPQAGGQAPAPAMQQSIMQQAPSPQDMSQMPAPTQELPVGQPGQQGLPELQAPSPQDMGQGGYYPETSQGYSDQGYYAPAPAMDTDTISEIADQVVSEKFSEFSKKTGDIVGFKNSIQDQVDDIDERLKRIESSIDKLQQAVVGKIGEFGESTAAIRKDVAALHDTTSKLMNPLIDNYKELQKISSKK
jgi:hypothetical protein